MADSCANPSAYDGENRNRAERNGEAPHALSPEPADMLHRSLARIIDMLVFAFLSGFYPVGMLGGFLYLLIADGLMDGRSLGKRIIGIRVVTEDDFTVAGYRESIIRNLPIALVTLFAVIPFVGWLLLITLGLLIVGAEIYLARTDLRGQRAGDILARTLVVMDEADERPPRPEPPQKAPDSRTGTNASDS